MNQQDDRKFAEIMSVLGEAFDKPPSSMKIEIYFKALEDIPIEKIQEAAVIILNTKTYGSFPLVAEIREAVAGGSDNLDVRALLAWNQAKDAIHKVGHYQSVAFDDPIISQIVRTWGGWEKWGDWPAEETKWKERDFIRQYKIYAQAPAQLPDQPDHLVGVADGYNQDKFPEFVQEPVQIGGDKQRRLK